jgi:uncharacterized membrane protein YozB (DUF420 family)
LEAHPLPTLNACLNAASGCFLCVGLWLIHRGRRRAHAAAMIAAALVSAAFLASYLTYHFVVVPEVGHTPFRRGGWLRPAYYALLLSHVCLALVNLPMVLWTLWLAARRDWARHRRLARWTWPIWLYVSITGVLVYLALYPLNLPDPGAP